MTGSRFTSAQEVFDAFPSTERDISAAPTHEPPLVYLQRLRRSETPEDAVSFLAYALGRRGEAGWITLRA